MKTAHPTMFSAALILALVAGGAAGHAQSAAPAATPPRAQPTTPAATPPRAQPAAPPAAKPPATQARASVTVEGDDKPWNRGVPLATRQTAREVFLEGNRLFNIPLYTRAAEQYLAALAKWKHPAFYFNLALTQLNLGQQVEARDSLEQALKHGEEPLGADRFAEAEKQLQELGHQLSRIRVTCPTEGAEVTLDGTTLFIGPGTREEWVKARDHEIAAKKPEYLPQARRVTAAPGKLVAIDLRLKKLIEERPWATWKPWAVVGTGFAIAAAGGVLHAISARKFNDYDAKFLTLPCAGSGGCRDTDIRPGLNAELSRARLEQKIAVGGYVAGGALLAAGATLLYLNRPHLTEQRENSSPTGGLAVIPTISADTLGVLLTVSH